LSTTLYFIAMPTLELSIVMPCLNEATTLEKCIAKAMAFLKRTGVHGEIIIADNGSIDGSQALALKSGARVENVLIKGYGAALQGGISAAQGQYIVMGDADDSYDFSALDEFVAKLRSGDDLVVGNRFKGGIAAGAMPFLHRYIGNPVLSFLGRLFFGASIGDFHCGLRGFRKEAIQKLNLTATGMEFASEMIVKATLSGLKISEVATTLSRDGRDRPPHLRTWRDGWRHLRFLLMFSPRWLFLYPGISFLLIGIVGQVLLHRGGLQLGAIGLDIHTMLYAAALAMVGVQMIWFALFTKVLGMTSGFLPRDTRIDKVLRMITLERGVTAGVLIATLGVIITIKALSDWAAQDYGAIDPRDFMRSTIPAVSMIIIGLEFVFASFFLSILLIERRPESLAQ
jgi:glycosyltransferase involved in cell wall biosynthesis